MSTGDTKVTREPLFSPTAPDIWQAVFFDDIFTGCKTQPLLLTCQRRRADGEVERQQFVTKSLGNPDIHDINLFAEIFGNLLARLLGLRTCDAHIIYFADDFLQATNPLLPKQISLRPGYGVGTVFDPPLDPIIADFKIPPALLAQATRLYAFDLLVFNQDRKRTNSNCAVRGDQLIAFDFDESFFFLDIGYKVPAWKVSVLGVGSSHVCRSSLRGSNPDWAPFIDALKLIDAPTLAAFVKDFPPSWKVRFQEVVDHLLEAQDEPKRLEIELAKSLMI